MHLRLFSYEASTVPTTVSFFQRSLYRKIYKTSIYLIEVRLNWR